LKSDLERESRRNNSVIRRSKWPERKDEAIMKKVYRLAAVTGMGLAMVPLLALAQTQAQPAVQPNAVSVVPMVLPADQQATREQLLKYYEVTRLRETLETTFKRVAEQSKQGTEKTVDETIANTPVFNKMTSAEKEKYKEIMYKFAEQSTTVLKVDQMIEDCIEVNQRYLSRSDLDAMIDFFGSTAGQHFLNQQPAILQEMSDRTTKEIGTQYKDLSGQMSKDIQALVAAAQAEQSNNQAGSKHTSFIDRLGTLVNALSNAYTPGQSFSQTLENAVKSSVNQQQ
jgi:hypothetical protein